MKSNFKFSEEGTKIKDRRIIIKTNEKEEKYLTTFILDYSEHYNITYNGKDEIKKIPSSPTFYKLLVVNNGNGNNKTKIDINVE
jgi:hypothetical protein